MVDGIPAHYQHMMRISISAVDTRNSSVTGPRTEMLLYCRRSLRAEPCHAACPCCSRVGENLALGYCSRAEPFDSTRYQRWF